MRLGRFLGLVAATMLVGCVVATGIGTASAVAAPRSGGAVLSGAKARKQAESVSAPGTIRSAERTVAAYPQRADAWAAIGHAYLGAGRLGSAELAFSGALRLDAGSGRAALGLALARIALGKTALALDALDVARGKIPDEDYALSQALGGRITEAVSILEAAVRLPAASARTRQNLALVYAMAGRWDEARHMAAFDLSPAEVDQRLLAWTSFVRPVGDADQLGALLGFRPVADDGLPRALAHLRPAGPATEMASAGAAGEGQFVQPSPQSDTGYGQAVAAAPAPAHFAPTHPGNAVSEPEAEVETAAADGPPADARPAQARPAAPQPTVAERSPQGRFVVQIAAYLSRASLDRGWAEHRRVMPWMASLGDSVAILEPMGRNRFHRLGIGGFQSVEAAQSLCLKIRQSGGACFVRASGSGQPWARFASGAFIRQG